MDKEQLLQELKQSLALGQVSQAEVLAALGQPEQKIEKHFRLSNILYYIGGAIVFLGVAVLIFENWQKNYHTRWLSAYNL